MLVPHYQGMIHSARHMDVGADPAASRADGAAHWQVINAAVGTNFNPADRDYLSSMFLAAPATGGFNYCAVSTRLITNMPAASSLQYHNYARAGTQTTSVTGSVVHVTANDVGTLQETMVGGQPMVCVMPPPAPPSPPQSPFPPPPPPPSPPEPLSPPADSPSPPTPVSSSPSATATVESTVSNLATDSTDEVWGPKSVESLVALILAILAFLMSMLALGCQGVAIRRYNAALPAHAPITTPRMKEVEVVKDNKI